jgi:hypothetical protein
VNFLVGHNVRLTTSEVHCAFAGIDGLVIGLREVIVSEDGEYAFYCFGSGSVDALDSSMRVRAANYVAPN